MSGIGKNHVSKLRSCYSEPHRQPKQVDHFVGFRSQQMGTRMRSVFSSIRTLKAVYLSPVLREEYQPEVSACWVLKRKLSFRAFSSSRPTRARGGTVNTTVGTPT